MEQKIKHLHMEVKQEEWVMIKIEAMKRGLTMKQFILGCVGEIVMQDKKHER